MRAHNVPFAKYQITILTMASTEEESYLQSIVYRSQGRGASIDSTAYQLLVDDQNHCHYEQQGNLSLKNSKCYKDDHNTIGGPGDLQPSLFARQPSLQ